MKNKILLCISLCLTAPSQPHVLKNTMLKNIDHAGFFDRAIIDIISIRQKIKNFLHGKHLWHGIKLTLSTTNNVPLETIMRRAETICGATFIILSPTYSNVLKFVTAEHKEAAQKYILAIQKLSLLKRQELIKFDGQFTGNYAINPFTNEKMPIYIADYAVELFDTRNNFPHIGVPAHNSKDFEFAQKNHLDIKIVVTGQSQVPACDQPHFNKDGKQLSEAYTKEDDEIVIINSGDFNGNHKESAGKVATAIQELKIGSALTSPIMYDFFGKKYSLENLKIIEETMLKESVHLSAQQKESFGILMNYAQADLLEIVEPFLVSIYAAKDLMIELIEESCKLRSTGRSYMMTWSQLKGNDSEKVIFKRDITTFQELAKFCSDLVNFLGDFASSCPHALESLKKLKSSHE